MANLDMGENIFSRLRVIDCGSFVAGPAAATVMADYGADVIHVETPGIGDHWRYQSQRPEVPHGPDNHFWTLTGRNKRSLALDLKGPGSRRVLHRLVEGSDVFITNVRKRSRAGIGIDYEQLAAVNERLVYASVTGYGEQGPEADQAAFDSTAYWGRSGLMDLIRPDPNGPPARSVTASGDHVTAMAVFGAIMMGLYARDRTGRGSYVGSSLLQSAIWSNACWIQGVLSGATVERPPVRTESLNAFNNHYQCSDGRWVTMAMNRQQQSGGGFERLFHDLGRPQYADDLRFATFEDRAAHSRLLIAIMDEAFAEKTAGEWRDIFQSHRFALSIIARIEDFVDDEQLRAAGAIVDFPGAAGSGLTVANPLFIDGYMKNTPIKAPDLGEHSLEVLTDLGFEEAEIKRLVDEGVVQLGER